MGIFQSPKGIVPVFSVHSATTETKGAKHPLMVIVEFVFWLIAIIIATNLIHGFIFAPFYVIGESMEKNFQQGNYVFVDKLSYRFHRPQRGDVIVFTPPWDPHNREVVELEKNIGMVSFQIRRWKGKIQRFFPQFRYEAENLDYKQYIKRIIALPQETITIQGDYKIMIQNAENKDGFFLQETYIDVPTKGNLTLTLGENEYFVMGDNRVNSIDSRGILEENTIAHTPHPISFDDIEGRVFLRLWPLHTIGLIRNPFESS